MPEPKVQNQTRPLLYIVALLGEHCDFDELRAKNEGERFKLAELMLESTEADMPHSAGLASELNAISEVRLSCGIDVIIA